MRPQDEVNKAAHGAGGQYVTEVLGELTPDTQRATAIHEAGHAVAAVALEIDFVRVSLGAHAGIAGRVEGAQPPARTASCPDATESYLVYLHAGAAASAVLGGAAWSGVRDDLLQAQQCAGLAYLRTTEYRFRLARARERAHRLVFAHRSAVEAVAAALERRGELRRGQVVAIVRSTTGRGADEAPRRAT